MTCVNFADVWNFVSSARARIVSMREELPTFLILKSSYDEKRFCFQTGFLFVVVGDEADSVPTTMLN